ncbi:MAG: UxaA family hydrolase [Chloroflexi bacterium]|nr:UxaA family hydrolase [Chloroflexota bacterium]MCL5109109.1 UxaA family hydrolase [Chloroflexota bacterium]
MQFLGFPRPDGSVGIRNYVAVLPGGLIATKICQFVPGTKTICTPNHGAGMTSRDREAVARLLIGLGRNPNVAAVLVHNASPGAGYPELSLERLTREIAKSGKPVEFLDVAEDAGGGLMSIARGVAIARELVRQASRVRREPFGLGQLVLGVKCGASDPTSGIAGNPAVGYLFDRVVDAGGVALFGETTEIIGAETVLARRAVDDATAGKILAAARFVEERALSVGEDIRTINPVPANIAAGITTLEEKSLGAIHKAGHHPIAGALAYGERPPGRGLYFVDNWMNHLSIFPGYAAAGAQLTIFQLGGGGIPQRVLLDPSPAVVAPLLWATANPSTAERCREGIDYYSGTVITGDETPTEAGQRFVDLVLDIASGTLTRGETMDYADPAEIYRLDPVF